MFSFEPLQKHCKLVFSDVVDFNLTTISQLSNVLLDSFWYHHDVCAHLDRISIALNLKIFSCCTQSFSNEIERRNRTKHGEEAANHRPKCPIGHLLLGNQIGLGEGKLG